MKILCLCSGGFDSVVMLKCVRAEYPNEEIHTLFFDYSQKSVEYEREKAIKISDECKAIFHEVTLPKFNWTNSDFYKEGFSGDKEYLEMRNLVFLSYALSFAESMSFTHVYMATLKSISYYDTSEDFFSHIRGIASHSNIEVVTPFSKYSKYELSYLAYTYGIRKDDFFSCDNPVNGAPCGVCPDCKALEKILSYYPTAIDSFLETFDCCSKVFQESVRREKITEMRVHNNHLCQLHCKHCYYGYESLKESPMSLEEYEKVFTQAKELGIDHFHFSGKEPLYDDSVFDIIKVLRKVHPDSFVSFVTNGITVPKYAPLLQQVNPEKVCVSVDDILSLNGVRKIKNVSDKALSTLRDFHIPVEVFIDLHSNNYNRVGDIISFIHKNYGVSKFLIRTIVPIGSAKDMVLLSPKQLNEAYVSVRRVCSEIDSIFCSFMTTLDYTYKILPYEYLPLSRAIQAEMRGDRLTSNLFVFGELFCKRYVNQITLTCDGYIQGCASESCFEEYADCSVGNIRTSSLQDLIKKGKESNLAYNSKSENNFTCFCRNPFTFSD